MGDNPDIARSSQWILPWCHFSFRFLRRWRISPAIMGKGLVGLGHFVGILALLPTQACPIGGVEELGRQSVLLARVIRREGRTSTGIW
jgi:hypothetical protein